ncbi:MAG: ABC transporter ATP-binding protein [Sphingobium phenoxybenzoativorans]
MVTITIEGLRISLSKHPALRGIDASLDGGMLIGIIGPNGAGKSTLARAILGLVKPEQGRVLIDAVDASALPRAKIARTIAYLPQGQTLHWPLDVERLVALGRLPHLAPFSDISSADQAAIDKAIALTDVEALRHRTATELSGGERARVLLARALAVEAPVLIADEPLASLDPGHQLEVMELLRAQAASGTLVIAVLHDLTLAARFCDRILLLNKGEIAADGDPSDVLNAGNLATVYGVRAWLGQADGAPVVIPLSRNP